MTHPPDSFARDIRLDMIDHVGAGDHGQASPLQTSKNVEKLIEDTDLSVNALLNEVPKSAKSSVQVVPSQSLSSYLLSNTQGTLCVAYIITSLFSLALIHVVLFYNIII